MGMGGISIWQLLIILAIVVMIFGTKRLRNLGSDLGSAVKGFKKGLGDEEKPEEEETDETSQSQEKVIEGKANTVDEKAKVKTGEKEN